MIKGLAVTPPLLGRISIGKVVEKNGKRLPEKDDQFTITTQLQSKEGWLPHPFDDELRKASGGKIRNIPMRLMFNEPDLNFRYEYTRFDRNTGRPMCVGNGESCKRYTADGIESFNCPSPEGCSLAANNACKPYGRLNVLIGDDDPLGSFIFRTTGFNSIRTLAARLHYFQAISGNKLACIPLELRLRGKSSRQSHGSPIYYVDLTIREGATLEDSLAEAAKLEAERKASGFDQAALDAIARQGFNNGAYEDNDEDAEGVVEEFFAESAADESTKSQSLPETPPSQRPSLSEKLAAKQVSAVVESEELVCATS